MENVTKKVLVVDDEKPLAHALQAKLQHEGYEVDIAFNGVEALEKIAAHTFDLVLLDLIMPKLDGFGVLKKLQESPTKPKVIVSTNLSQEEDSALAKQLGASDYYVKSDTQLTQVIEIIKKVLA